MLKMTTIYDPKEIPDGQDSYAILEPESTYVEGAERSRTNPGGYPAHTVRSWSIRIYTDRKEWEETIHQRETEKSRHPYKAVILRTPNIVVAVTTDIKID